MNTRTWALVGGTLIGLAVARRLSRHRSSRHGADLFHARPPMRHQALTWLARHPSRAAIARLQEYSAWEPIPTLQRRGIMILERMTQVLGQEEVA